MLSTFSSFRTERERRFRQHLPPRAPGPAAGLSGRRVVATGPGHRRAPGSRHKARPARTEYSLKCHVISQLKVPNRIFQKTNLANDGTCHLQTQKQCQLAESPLTRGWEASQGEQHADGRVAFTTGRAGPPSQRPPPLVFPFSSSSGRMRRTFRGISLHVASTVPTEWAAPHPRPEPARVTVKLSCPSLPAPARQAHADRQPPPGPGGRHL